MASDHLAIAEEPDWCTSVCKITSLCSSRGIWWSWKGPSGIASSTNRLVGLIRPSGRAPAPAATSFTRLSVHQGQWVPTLEGPLSWWILNYAFGDSYFGSSQLVSPITITWRSSGFFSCSGQQQLKRSRGVAVCDSCTRGERECVQVLAFLFLDLQVGE